MSKLETGRLPQDTADQMIRPSGKIVLPPATPDAKIAEIIKVCNEAGIGPKP